MKHLFFRVFICLSVPFFALSCNRADNKPKEQPDLNQKASSVMVFAAASLTDVLSEVIDSFEVKYGTEVKTNLASSGTLARQIEQGGTPDIFISASKRWADYVDSLGCIVQGFMAEIATNELVLIAPVSSELEVPVIDSTLDFLSLLGKGRLSMGDPAHVPAGKYARQSLEYYGWFGKLQDKILPAKDVRSALMVVEMGESPVGIVYRTDAIKSEKIKILNAFEDKSHKRIVYVAGICRENKTSKDFYTFLNSDETLFIWEKHGFKK